MYRVSAPKPPAPPDPYLLAWASLRRRRATMWISGLAWLPMGALAIHYLPDLVPLVLVPHMAVVAVSSLMASYFRCPHCGELFAKRSAFWTNALEAFKQCCVHCGIRAGTPKSAVVARDPEQA